MKQLSIVCTCFLLSCCGPFADPIEDIYVFDKIMEDSEEIVDDFEHHHHSRRDTI